MATYPKRILSVCSGIAGLDLGVKLATGAETICYVEREAYSAATLVARMEEQVLAQAPIWDDLTTFDGKPWRGKVDCIIAGFPCQPWSVAGKKKGTADERWLWDDIWRIVCEVRPGYVFLENVPGLLRGGIEHVLRSMAESGYDAEWGCFSAEQCRFAHKRERLFILGKLENAISERPGRRRERFEQSEIQGRECAEDKIERPSEQLAESSVIGRRNWSNNREGRRFQDDIGATEKDKQKWQGREPWIGEVGTIPDTKQQGCERRESDNPEGREVQGEGSTPEYDRTYFLPGPNDSRGWEDCRRSDETLEPALRRKANGIPEWMVEAYEYRPDRIRALGNGVVPLVAAFAFMKLLRRIEDV